MNYWTSKQEFCFWMYKLQMGSVFTAFQESYLISVDVIKSNDVSVYYSLFACVNSKQLDAAIQPPFSAYGIIHKYGLDAKQACGYVSNLSLNLHFSRSALVRWKPMKQDCISTIIMSHDWVCVMLLLFLMFLTVAVVFMAYERFIDLHHACVHKSKHFPWRVATSFFIVHCAHIRTQAHTKAHMHM